MTLKTNKPRPRRGSTQSAPNQRDFWDKFWHDRKGNLVVFQSPNVFIIIWAITFMLSQIIRDEPLQSIFSWISFVALVLWSLKEAIFGVNYFRKILGTIILVLSILVRF